MQGKVKWWAISPHHASKQGEFGVTTKHARKGEMAVKWRAILPHQACKEGEFEVTTKHAMNGEMVGHFASPSMQARRVRGDNQTCKEG